MSWIGTVLQWVGLVGLIATAFFGYRALRPRKLSWSNRTLRALSIDPTAHDLKVIFGEKPLEDPYYAYVELRNTGWSPIRPDDIHGPLQVSAADADCQFVNAVARLPDDSFAEMHVSEGIATFEEHVLINRKESLEITILSDGRPGRLNATWRVAGLTRLADVGRSNRIINGALLAVAIFGFVIASIRAPETMFAYPDDSWAQGAFISSLVALLLLMARGARQTMQSIRSDTKEGNADYDGDSS